MSDKENIMQEEMFKKDSEVNRIDIKEFREFGYLQEINRQFLHPHGLALEIVIEDDGTEHLGGIWDYRGDPEGIYFGDELDYEKAYRVADHWSKMTWQRQLLLGWIIQPIITRRKKI